METAKNQKDHWSASAYQNSASFVPKLAGKVLGWLDVQNDDVVLDIGCGDGIIPVQIAHTLSKGSGSIHGIDSSEDMIAAAKKAAATEGEEISGICTFQVLDASSPQDLSTLPSQTYTKIFSNAALHWILRPEATRKQFFTEIKRLLKPNGVFVFEMGGMGNVAEMRTALLSVVGRRLWMRSVLASSSSSSSSDVNKEGEGEGEWKIEKLEREYRATPTDKGGIEGWVKLMGKQFFDVLGEGEERKEAEREVCEVLESVCRSPGGGDWIGFSSLLAGNKCMSTSLPDQKFIFIKS
ncbi:putative methyltransferase type 11 protein [Botrytis fragariae]|uniref:Putative methyltransferase type 11 protein n=1 Tax=Botrytis fragariae TaxID=1964551 RepID=A0A8H6AR17_9HELO|nr:putative methyltransferase type 11 protein [Botrytis fragariae]KAF5872049.1 putative methyltransferase type 11 protein [Botrytis fragariae]